MTRLLAIVFLGATCLSWPSLAQQQKHTPHHVPDTRVGQVSQEVVAQFLREHGFAEVTNLRLEANIYRAEATKNGARVNVEVDARTGRLLKP
jgi:hypothetical protein